MLNNVSFNWMDVLEEIYFTPFGNDYSDYETILPNDIGWKLVPLYPSCQIIDLMTYVNKSKNISPISIVFSFKTDKDLGISIFLEEKNKIHSRTSKHNSLSYIGPLIQNKDLSQARFVKSIIRISQTIDSQLDPKKKCVNYPTEEFETYNLCDEAEVRAKVQDELGVTPFWMTDDYETVTKLTYDSDDNIYSLLPFIYDGTFESQCPKPCLNSQVSI